MATPNCRQLGQTRLDVAKAAKTPEDWKKLWKKPAHAWPFAWGSCWKQCTEYRVDDYAAEVGFFIDVLGFPVNAFGPDFAMFTSPDKDFFFAVVPTPPGEKATPPETLRLQFMIDSILETALELEKRGVTFEKRVASHNGSPIYTGHFRTPAGIAVDLWGMIDPKTTVRRAHDKPKKAKAGAR